jgi:hypothetical protein
MFSPLARASGAGTDTMGPPPGSRDHGLASFATAPLPDHERGVVDGGNGHTVARRSVLQDEACGVRSTIEPKWQVAQKLCREIQTAVEKQQLTPLDGARTISSLTAALFGYDEFILREVSPEAIFASNRH